MHETLRLSIRRRDLSEVVDRGVAARRVDASEGLNKQARGEQDGTEWRDEPGHGRHRGTAACREPRPVVVMADRVARRERSVGLRRAEPVCRLGVAGQS